MVAGPCAGRQVMSLSVIFPCECSLDWACRSEVTHPGHLCHSSSLPPALHPLQTQLIGGYVQNLLTRQVLLAAQDCPAGIAGSELQGEVGAWLLRRAVPGLQAGQCLGGTRTLTQASLSVLFLLSHPSHPG